MNLRKSEGVTLVALVVTILVLLILTSVTLNLSVGTSGIIEKAEESVGQSQKAEDRDKLDLAIIAVIREEGMLKIDEIIKYLKDFDYEKGEQIFISQKTGCKYKVSTNGVVELVEE